MSLPTESKSFYSDEEMLQLSGIQHYVFCPRQWALIHLEQLWADNALTTEGSILHSNVDNPFFRETNGTSVITIRGFRIASHALGLSGIADAIEIYPFPEAPSTKTAIIESGLFNALPVEYKRGRPKVSDCDRIQATAQSLILEEMLNIEINRCALFYWETRHREYVDITAELREATRNIANDMHRMVKDNILPPAIRKSHCRNCSLIDYCLPSLTGKSAQKYLKESLSSISSL